MEIVNRENRVTLLSRPPDIIPLRPAGTLGGIGLKIFVVGTLLMITFALTPLGAAVPDQENAMTLPGGLYVYSYGSAGFPNSHGFELWQESNGMGAVAGCSINEGLPMGHIDAGKPSSNLQVRACGAVAADTSLLA